jgi:septal ring factor EnvC (AmiA/AmiB activator)
MCPSGYLSVSTGLPGVRVGRPRPSQSKKIRKELKVMKEKLILKIETNKKKLIELQTKKENLEREISSLERKLTNQKHALMNLPSDTKE